MVCFSSTATSIRLHLQRQMLSSQWGRRNGKSSVDSSGGSIRHVHGAHRKRYHEWCQKYGRCQVLATVQGRVFATCKKVSAGESLRYINTIDSKIQFTSKEKKDGVLNFLDIKDWGTGHSGGSIRHVHGAHRKRYHEWCQKYGRCQVLATVQGRVFATCKKVSAGESLRYINTIDSKIQFTSKEKKDGVLNFLDITLRKKEDGSIATSVQRKPTNTYRILQWSSNHPKSAKLAAVDSMVRRLDTHNTLRVTTKGGSEICNTWQTCRVYLAMSPA